MFLFQTQGIFIERRPNEDLCRLPIYTRGMHHVWWREEVHIALWWGDLRETDHLEDPDSDGRIILKGIFKVNTTLCRYCIFGFRSILPHVSAVHIRALVHKKGGGEEVSFYKQRPLPFSLFLCTIALLTIADVYSRSMW